MGRYGEHFLRESWQNKQEKDSPSPEEEQRIKDILLYTRLEETIKSENDSTLEKLFSEVESYVVQYVRTVFSSVRASRSMRQQQSDLATIEAADQARKLAHNALIDSLNILSRQFRENGLDNEWRREIGEDRRDIGRWAANVARVIYNKIQEE